MGGRQPPGPTGAAAADYLAELLRGPERAGEVVALRSHAALAAVDTGRGARLIAITAAADATRTANTLLLTGVALPGPGSRVRVGAGALQIAGRRHPILRYWPSGTAPQPVDPAAPHQLARWTSTAVRGLSTGTVFPLLTAVATGSRLVEAARSLVGRGPGSTPAGDDVLAGVALSLRMTDRLGVLSQLHSAITPDLHDRTTALSADLLRAALAGHASPEVRSLLLTLRPGTSPERRRRAVQAVLALGSTSGADLLLGLTGALLTAAPAAAHAARDMGRRPDPTSVHARKTGRMATP